MEHATAHSSKMMNVWFLLAVRHAELKLGKWVKRREVYKEDCIPRNRAFEEALWGSEHRYLYADFWYWDRCTPTIERLERAGLLERAVVGKFRAHAYHACATRADMAKMMYPLNLSSELLNNWLHDWGADDHKLEWRDLGYFKRMPALQPLTNERKRWTNDDITKVVVRLSPFQGKYDLKTGGWEVIKVLSAELGRTYKSIQRCFNKHAQSKWYIDTQNGHSVGPFSTSLEAYGWGLKEYGPPNDFWSTHLWTKQTVDQPIFQASIYTPEEAASKGPAFHFEGLVKSCQKAEA